jgi:hypothetical protein
MRQRAPVEKWGHAPNAAVGLGRLRKNQNVLTKTQRHTERVVNPRAYFGSRIISLARRVPNTSRICERSL